MTKKILFTLSTICISNLTLLTAACGTDNPPPSAVTLVQNQIRDILQTAKYGNSYDSKNKAENYKKWTVLAPEVANSKQDLNAPLKNSTIINFNYENTYDSKSKNHILTSAFAPAASYFTARIFRQNVTDNLKNNTILKPIDGYLPLNLYPEATNPTIIPSWGPSLSFKTANSDPKKSDINNSINNLPWAFQYGDRSASTINKLDIPDLIPNYSDMRTQLNHLMFLNNDFAQIYNKFPLHQSGITIDPAFVLQTIITPVNEYAGINILHSLQKFQPTINFSQEAVDALMNQHPNGSQAIKELWSQLKSDTQQFPFLSDDQNYNLFLNNVVFHIELASNKVSQIKLTINVAGNSKSLLLKYQITNPKIY